MIATQPIHEYLLEHPSAEDEGSDRLPVGKTCRNCAWFDLRCSWLLSRQPDVVVCDWTPSRFQKVKESIFHKHAAPTEAGAGAED